MRHFDVQLIGGMVLNDGQIAEMKTGEGKTLVSTLAGYLNALPGEGVHVVTVNDYLAKRDSEWMGRIYRFLGMEVGHDPVPDGPVRAHPRLRADVTYGTNAEFGFDYLRDNMVVTPEDRVQRGHHFAIVDEVDSILIDEARTPLIISGAGTKSADTYKQFAKVVPRLRPDEDFELDESKRTIAATEDGLRKLEGLLSIDNIYADPSGQLVNHLQQSLKAEFLFKRDVDYVVKDGEVMIVDEFTGRMMYRPSLLGGPAPGDRGQGARARPRGEPDARDHHAAELLPPLREALGHDRYRPDRGRRVPRHLQASGHGRPHQPRHDP